MLSNADASVHTWAIGGFTVARLLHTFAYATANPRIRPLAWGAGLLCTLVMAGNGIRAVLSR